MRSSLPLTDRRFWLSFWRSSVTTSNKFVNEIGPLDSFLSSRKAWGPPVMPVSAKKETNKSYYHNLLQPTKEKMELPKAKSSLAIQYSFWFGSWKHSALANVSPRTNQSSTLVSPLSTLRTRFNTTPDCISIHWSIGRTTTSNIIQNLPSKIKALAYDRHHS